MNETLKAFQALANEIWEEAKVNGEKADEAFDKMDLGLSGYHRGMHFVNAGIASRIEAILEGHREDEK